MGLERHHRPLTQRFGDAGLPASSPPLEGYATNGYCAPIDLLSESDVQALRARLASIGESLPELEGSLYEVEDAWQARPDEVVLHFLGGWRVDELLHDLVWHPTVAQLARAALAIDGHPCERPRFWHDQVFWKPPGHPGVVPWHQDYAYWDRTGPPAHVTVFIALDDCDDRAGCLEVVPGSQRWGLLPPVDFGGPREQLLAHLSPEQRAAFAPRPVPLRAGQASLHHSHLIHGSGPNRADHPRRALVLNFMHPDTRSRSAEPLLRGTPPVAPGQVVEGDFFPLV